MLGSFLRRWVAAGEIDYTGRGDCSQQEVRAEASCIRAAVLINTGETAEVVLSLGMAFHFDSICIPG